MYKVSHETSLALELERLSSGVKPRSQPGVTVTLYTFYPREPGGLAQSFEVFELDDDVAASDLAAAMLAQHPGAAFIGVWSGDRKVCEVAQTAAKRSTVTWSSSIEAN